MKYLQLVILALLSLLVFIDPGQAHSNSDLFQCQTSHELRGQVYTPNIPDFYFNHQNAATFITSANANLTMLSESITYIFTIPRMSDGRNCSGNFSALQYCYQINTTAQAQGNDPVFSLNFMNQTGNFSFMIESNILVRPNEAGKECAVPISDQQICCQTRELAHNERLSIPSSEFTFGLVSRNMQFLSFANSASDFRVERFEIGVAIIGLISGGGVTISSGEGSRFTTRSIVLFRFLMDHATDFDSADSGDDTTTSMANSDSSSTVNISTENSTAFIGGLVGAIAALLAFILLTAAITIIILLARRRIKLQSSQNVYPHRNRETIHTRNNVAYVAGVIQTRNNVAYSIATHAEGQIHTHDNVAYSVGYTSAASIPVTANACYSTGTSKANQLYATPTVGGASSATTHQQEVIKDYDYVIPHL